ncbi:MAG: DUF1080 domain-containing protein [Planctomycetales bacterium]|nr:DUF1080 domain-containing protein [Planctomycetales bacterium]
MTSQRVMLAVVLCLTSWPAYGQTQPAAIAPEAAQTKLKGLLITGGCCHDYVRQVLILTEGLSQRMSISWDIVHGMTERETKLDVYSKEDWAKGYDIVVHNECFGSVDDVEFVERIVKGHVKSGAAAVVIHCSMHSYRAAKTQQWRKFLGVTSQRHEKGGRQLDVSRVNHEHPITKGFPEKWQTPNGELYVIENVWPKTTPLATAYGIDTKQQQVCMWTNEFENVKVFGTTLGHHNETMMSDVWLDTVARGALWAVGKLKDDGEPAPGYAGTGKGPFSFQVSAGMPTEADWSRSVRFPESEKPVALFDGKTLDGWKGHKERYFTVQDGVIVARNSVDDAPPVSTYLLTERKNYRNLRLLFEGKLVRSRMHSGIALWGQQFGMNGEPNSYQGHLVMFPANWGFWDLYRRNSIYKDDGRAKQADHVGDWNRMEILAIDSRIRLAVNGVEVADWTDPKPELCQPGPIGLQLHSNRVAQEVHFRGLVLSENPEPRLITVSKP